METNDNQDLLEDLIAESMLIELFNEKKAEVFENVVFEGKKRYYVEDLTEKDYNLENTTPYQLNMLGHFIEEHAWGRMLCRTAQLLLELYPEYTNKILDFRCTWTKMQMFSNEKRTNFKQIADNLYINCNHTALHSCWFLQELLDFFNIDKANMHFLIHRPSSAEPKHIQSYVEQRFKRNFAEFVKIKYNKTEEYTDTMLARIEKYLNPTLAKISKSYPNLFLFDDYATAYNYIKKLSEKLSINLSLPAKAKTVLNKYLDYLIEFYKEK